MDIIDFHAHIFPDDLAPRVLSTLIEQTPSAHAFTDGTLGGLRASMRKNSITQAVLVPIATKPSQVRIINASCAGLMAPDIIPFGTLHPAMQDPDSEVTFLKTSGVKGVKLHPEFQNFHIDDPKVFPLYEVLCAEGLITVFHAGKDPGPFTNDHSLPPAFKKVHRNFPKLRIVAAHMGGWMLWKDVEEHMAGLPMHFDTSAVRDLLPADECVRLMRRHGIERIIFGSDTPWFDQGDEVRWIDSLTLTSREKDLVFHGNAEALLGG